MFSKDDPATPISHYLSRLLVLRARAPHARRGLLSHRRVVELGVRGHAHRTRVSRVSQVNHHSTSKSWWCEWMLT